MAVINPHTTRGTGTVLTAAIYNGDHQNHITNANNLNAELVTDTANIATQTAIVSGHTTTLGTLTPLLGKPTIQAFAANGTWTKPTNCKRIIVEAVGGGGGGGGASGAAGQTAAAGGGGSGFYGWSNPIDVTGVANGAVVIGAGGAGGAAGANAGGTGGTTQITIGATTYTWPGGDGAPGAAANTSDHAIGLPGTFSAQGANVYGSSRQGNTSWMSNSDTDAISGSGAAGPFGPGGDRTVILTTGGAVGNPSGTNTGGGGGGAATQNQAVNRAGGAGGTGFMRIWEFY